MAKPWEGEGLRRRGFHSMFQRLDASRRLNRIAGNPSPSHAQEGAGPSLSLWERCSVADLSKRATPNLSCAHPLPAIGRGRWRGAS